MPEYKDELLEEMQEYVSRGARKLDVCNPGWADKVNNTKLDMYDPGCDCVLAQLYGSFVRGLWMLDVEDADFFGFSADELADLFVEYNYGTTRSCYNTLTSLWNDEIDERQGV